jgi:hypothetical protein
MRRGVTMPAVERHVIRRSAKAERAEPARVAFEQGRVRIKKPHPMEREWPDRYGVEWAFQDARKVR